MVSKIKQGSMSVLEYEKEFLGHPIMKEKVEEDLIKIAIDGLKKEIRDGLESTAFPTLRTVFQEASAVEDILEKEKKEKRKRKMKSPRRRKKKMRLNRSVDPEDEWMFADTTRTYISEDSNGEDSDSEDSDEEEESYSEWSYLGETTVDTSDDESANDFYKSPSGVESPPTAGSVDDSPPE